MTGKLAGDGGMTWMSTQELREAAYSCVIWQEYPHWNDGIMKGAARFQVKRASFLESKGGSETQDSK